MKASRGTKWFCSYKQYCAQPADNKQNQTAGVIRIIITERFLQEFSGILQKENREGLEQIPAPNLSRTSKVRKGKKMHRNHLLVPV